MVVQVLYNAAAVHSRLDQLDKARDILISASQEKGRGGRGGNMEVALDMISVSTRSETFTEDIGNLLTKNQRLFLTGQSHMGREKFWLYPHIVF
jgi:hypothetical protein